MPKREAGERFVCDCGTPCIQLPNASTGRLAPITTKRTPYGNVEIDASTRTYRIVPASDRANYPEGLFLNHWTDCTSLKFRNGRPRNDRG